MPRDKNGEECNHDCEICPYYHDPCFEDILGDIEEEDED